MMGLAFAQAMFKRRFRGMGTQRLRREERVNNGASIAYDQSEPEIVKRHLKETEGPVSTKSSISPATKNPSDLLV